MKNQANERERLTTAVPANIGQAVKLVGNLGNGRRNDGVAGKSLELVFMSV